jgi:hypothetical protein
MITNPPDVLCRSWEWKMPYQAFIGFCDFGKEVNYGRFLLSKWERVAKNSPIYRDNSSAVSGVTEFKVTFL